MVEVGAVLKEKRSDVFCAELNYRKKLAAIKDHHGVRKETKSLGEHSSGLSLCQFMNESKEMKPGSIETKNFYFPPAGIIISCTYDLCL